MREAIYYSINVYDLIVTETNDCKALNKQLKNTALLAAINIVQSETKQKNCIFIFKNIFKYFKKSSIATFW